MTFHYKKWVCDDCGKIVLCDEILSAPHPFDDGEKIYGCPYCKSAQSLLVACDEPGCTLPSSCGTPTKNGYRDTCHDHQPAKDK